MCNGVLEMTRQTIQRASERVRLSQLHQEPVLSREYYVDGLGRKYSVALEGDTAEVAGVPARPKTEKGENMTYKNIITGFNPFVKYHDDMHNEEVKIISFPYDNLFGDFRVFNGLRLDYMDALLGRIREIMVEIANVHSANTREEELKNRER